VEAALAVGKRVYVRHPSRSDAAAFVDSVIASRVLHDRWVAPPATRETYLEWLRGARPEIVQRHLICRRDDHAIAGFVNLSSIIRGNLMQAFVGYAAFVPHEGQGLLGEGLALVVRRGFVELGLHRIEANIQPENDRSRQLARRAGFRLEGYSPRYLKVRGRWRDHERWALSSEDYRKDRASP
jgi:ribosomal-protein-alanine N-acetyltransferase